MTAAEIRELIRAAGLCLVCGRTNGQHSLDCPAHDERTCVVCSQPVQIAVSFDYEPAQVAL